MRLRSCRVASTHLGVRVLKIRQLVCYLSVFEAACGYTRATNTARAGLNAVRESPATFAGRKTSDPLSHLSGPAPPGEPRTCG